MNKDIILNKIFLFAKDKIDNIVAMPENPAVIFDIDNTLIDYKGECIQPIVNLYNYVKTKGITPLIITSRAYFIPNLFWTMKQLKDCNISGYNALTLRPESELDQYKYKRNARKKFVEEGYNIIMSVGDNFWDVGEFGGISILLPS